MRYVRDVPADDQAVIDAERAHVIAHLSAIVSPQDDPAAHVDRVRTWVINLVRVVGDEPGPRMVRVVGEVDAEPDAPYLKTDFDPWAGVDPELFAAEIDAAQRDEEVLRGQA